MNLYELPTETVKALDAYLSCFDPESGEQVATDEECSAAYAKFKELENKQGDAAEWILKTRANAEARIAGLEAEAPPDRQRDAQADAPALPRRVAVAVQPDPTPRGVRRAGVHRGGRVGVD